MSETARAVRKPSWCSQLSSHILAHQRCFGATLLTQFSMSGLSVESMQSTGSAVTVLKSLFTLRTGVPQPAMHHNAWTTASLSNKTQCYLAFESLDNSTRILLARVVAWKPIIAMSPWFAGLSRWQWSVHGLDFVRYTARYPLFCANVRQGCTDEFQLFWTTVGNTALYLLFHQVRKVLTTYE